MPLQFVQVYIDNNEILRSIALIGAGKTSEYVVCENCFLRLASGLKDYAENQNLKRIIKGQVYYGSQLDEKGRVTLSTMLDERAIH